MVLLRMVVLLFLSYVVALWVRMFLFVVAIFGVVSFVVGVVWLFCVVPLRTDRASMAFVLISSSRSLLIQNHISSGVAFGT